MAAAGNRDILPVCDGGTFGARMHWGMPTKSTKTVQSGVRGPTAPPSS